MAVSLALRIVTAPLTHHHVVDVFHSSNGSGFGAEEHLTHHLDTNDPTLSEAEAKALDTRLAQAHRRALEAIRNDTDYQRAIARQTIGNVELSRLAPKTQFFALAPRLAICESDELPDDHPIWNLYQRSFTLSVWEVRAILDALRHGDLASSLLSAEKFLFDHLGAQAVLLGD